MIDFDAAQVRSHRRNTERYCGLLVTQLTDLERQYLHKRIADEHAQLKQLEKGQGKRGARQLSKSLRPPPTTARSSGATSSCRAKTESFCG